MCTQNNKDNHLSSSADACANEAEALKHVYAFCLDAMTIRKFPSILETYGINCIADFRPPILVGEQRIAGYDIKGILREKNTFYNSFYEEMVRYNPNHHNQKGMWGYGLALADEKVKEGLERLVRGYRLGYTIAIIDGEPDLRKAMRQKLVGRYFCEQGIDVVYIEDTGNMLTHSQYTKTLEAKKDKRMQANALGEIGEKLAADYLIANGFTIVDTNWNLHKGCEIDIVARKGNVFHCVEVKTRRSDALSAPVSAINYKKMRNVCKAAASYRARNGFFHCEFVIDSIGIVYRSATDFSITMYDNIASVDR